MMIWEWTLLSLGLLWLGGWVWVWLGWWRVARKKHDIGCLQSFSILVAAHNEESNLPALLTSLAKLTFAGEWELVLALDRCTDSSKKIAEQAKASFPVSLKLVQITATPAGWSPKKWALTQGLAACRFDNLALTDADCVVSAGWLDFLDQHLCQGKDLVLGLGKYEVKKGLLGRVIAWETAFTAFQFAGAAGWGHAYMGLGRNMAVRKKLLAENPVWETRRAVLSGDDDLLVNHASKGRAVGVMIETGSESWSVPRESWPKWFRQKMRHVSSSAYYQRQSQFWLAAFHGVHGIWWGVWAMAWGISGLTPESLFALYCLRVLPATLGWAIMPNKPGVAWIAYPALDFFYFLYNLTLIPLGLIRRPSWT